MLTQIISGNALLELGKMIHQVRHQYGIPQLCGCDEAQKYKDKEEADLAARDDKKKLNGISKELLKNVKEEPKSGGLVNGSVKAEKRGGSKTNGKDEDGDMSNSPLSLFADVALSYDKRDSEASLPGPLVIILYDKLRLSCKYHQGNKYVVLHVCFSSLLQ